MLAVREAVGSMTRDPRDAWLEVFGQVADADGQTALVFTEPTTEAPSPDEGLGIVVENIRRELSRG